MQWRLLAHPWWVNLLVLVPVATFALFRRGRISFHSRRLAGLAIFGLAFGFVEAAVVVYLVAAIGVAPGHPLTLAELRSLPGTYDPAVWLAQFPHDLLIVETFREAATIIMLVCIALLSAQRTAERWAAFLWTFAAWDVAYYAGLFATLHWPSSLKDMDVLFLIPSPWIAQVWFPLLVSGLTMLAVAASSRNVREEQAHRAVGGSFAKAAE